MLLKIFDDNVFITKVFPKTYIDSVATMICGRGHLKKIYAFMAKVKLIKHVLQMLLFITVSTSMIYI